jgi:uncharacterized membrane protein
MMFQDFIHKYFIQPIIKNEGYNPVNTTVYAVVTVLLAYLIFKFLKKLKIKIDKTFVVAISPYILLGSILRVLQDYGVLNSYLFVTPLLFFWGVPIVMLILLFSLALERFGMQYFKFMFFVGILAIPFFILPLKLTNPYAAFLVFILFLPWLIFFKIFKWTKENKIVSLIQIFDATTTFVSINFFGYLEQHVLPNLFISFFGSWSFIFVKLAAVVSILFLIDKFSKDKEFNNYLKICIGFIGAFTGIRDFTRLLLFV